MLGSNASREVVTAKLFWQMALIFMMTACHRPGLEVGAARPGEEEVILATVASRIRSELGTERILLRHGVYCSSLSPCDSAETRTVWPEPTLQRLAQRLGATAILRDTAWWGPMDTVFTAVVRFGPPRMVAPDSATVDVYMFYCPGFWIDRYTLGRVAQTWAVRSERWRGGGDLTRPYPCRAKA
jgi:hypothetical protein